MEGAALLEGAVVIEYKYRTAAAVLEGAALLEGAVVIELLRYLLEFTIRLYLVQKYVAWEYLHIRLFIS